MLVADAFDALTSDRPYRRGRSPRAALEELRARRRHAVLPPGARALEALYRDEPVVLATKEKTLAGVA